jgi:colicin import membrane protein
MIKKLLILVMSISFSIDVLATSTESLSASVTYYDKNCEQLSLAGEKKYSELDKELGGFLDRTRNKKLGKELKYWKDSYLFAEVLNIKEQVCEEHKEKLGQNYDTYFILSLSELRDKEKRELLQKEKEDILNELKANYINQIASRVHNQWRYQGAKDSWGCDVHILQDVDGNVQSVKVQTCNTKERAFKNAIERAIYKASPLPQAPDQSVFDREILFHFRVD